MFNFTFLNESTKLTGISNLLEIGDYSILLDCGKFWEDNKIQLPFEPQNINAVIISHAHVEHFSGLIFLINRGYKGKIYVSEGTGKILPYMFEEYIKSFYNFKQKFINSLLNIIKNRLVSIPYKKVVNLTENITIRFKPAFHIFGSSFVEIDLRKGTHIEKKIVYSGDLGSTQTPMLQSPKSPWKADFLILESTFGDVLHPLPHLRKEKLKKIITNALNNQEIIIIPSYTFGRIQEFLFELNSLVSGRFEIVIDSPVVKKLPSLLNDIKSLFENEIIKKLKKKGDYLNFGKQIFIESEEEHFNFIEKLKRANEFKLMIAPSEDASSGRILDYLKNFLEQDSCNILFLNKPSENSIGNSLINNEEILIDGKIFRKKAKIHKFFEYSEHADRLNLINFVKRMRYKPEKIALIHGTETSIQSLLNEMKKEIKEIEIKTSNVKNARL